MKKTDPSAGSAAGAPRAGRAWRAAGRALRVLAIALVAVLRAYNVYTLVARYAFGVGIPTVFGYGCAAVETGSMEPEISAGDFIVIHAEDEYAVGDVITFYDSARGQYVTHRVILVSESGYTTKGDANNAQDNFTVPPSAVVGRVVAVLRGFGRVIGFLQTPVGLLSIVAFAAAVWGLFALGSYLFRRRAAPEQIAAENTSEQIAAENAVPEQTAAENAADAERSARSAAAENAAEQAAAENAAEQAAAENAAPQNETERNTLRGGRAGD